MGRLGRGIPILKLMFRGQRTVTMFNVVHVLGFYMRLCILSRIMYKTQGKIDLRNESGRPMKVKVVGGVSEK